MTINALFVRIGASAVAPVKLGLGAAFTAKLGPLTATVDGIGTDLFSLPLTVGGNLGPLDLASGSSRRPASASPSTAAASPAAASSTSTPTTSATGRAGARVPGASSPQGDRPAHHPPARTASAASRCSSSSAPSSRPIQLGFGFTLNGVGGLLGLNRTVDVERLRSRACATTRSSSILFPTDIVANADRITQRPRQSSRRRPAASSSARWRRSAGARRR